MVTENKEQNKKNTGGKSKDSATNSQAKLSSVDNNNEFEQRLDEMKEIVHDGSKLVEESKVTLEKAMDSGRKLAEQYVDSKRVELERYANQALETAQARLIETIDISLRKLTEVFEQSVVRGRNALQSNLSKIDERPAIPVILALVGGCMLGIFMSNRAQVTGAKGRSKREGSSTAKNAA